MTPSLNGHGNGHIPIPQQQIIFQEETIDLRPFLYRYLRNWYWIALSTLFFIGVAWMYLSYAPEVYKIKGSLLIRSDDRKGVTPEDFVFSELGFGGSANLENELQILKSYPVLNQVIDSLNLEFNYIKKEGFKAIDLYDTSPIKATVLDISQKKTSLKTASQNFVLTPDSDETFKLFVGEEDTISARFSIPFSIEERTLLIDRVTSFDYPINITLHGHSKRLKYYLAALEVELLEDSDILTLSLEDEAPQRAIDFINQLIAIYNQSIVKEKRAVAENTLQFIEERLQYITKELYDVEKQAERYMTRNEVPIELESSSAFYLDEISNSDKVIAELKFQQSFIKNLQAYLSKPENTYNFLSSLPEIGEASGFSASIKQYNDLLANREKLLLAANPKNPQVQLIEDQITSLRGSVLASLGQINNDLQNRITQMQERVDPIVKRLNNIPKNQRELLQIMRQQQIKQSLFLFLLEKREETGLTLAAQVADTRVINPPTNLELVAPKKAVILAGSTFLGLFLSLMILTLLEIFRNTISGQEDIKQVTNTPILGAIAESKKEEKIVVKKGKRSSLAEMFRLLHTNLQFMYPTVKEKGLKVLVTSSSSAEGKTFISLNLGASMALSGEDTLLVGFDLRKPKLSTYLGEEDGKLRGVSNYLAGMVDDPLDLVLKVPSFENLYYIGSGPIPPDPSSLISRERTTQLFEKLSARFKYIVIDSPPVGLVTDAFLLGKFADVSLYISRQGVTHKGQLKIIDDIYKGKKLPRPSIVLNGAKAGKGYGYGYGDGYGGYYEENHATKKVNSNSFFKSEISKK